MAVPMAPTMPPTPWMPKTSRLSSYLNIGFSVTTAQRQTSAGNGAEDDRADEAGEAGGRGDGDEAGDGARGSAEQQAWPRVNYSASDPGEGGGGGRE